MVYAPTEDADECGKGTYYEQLQNVHDKLLKHDVKIMIGDLNAKVGKDNNWRKIIGPNRIRTRNSNDQRLLQNTTW